MPEPDLQTSDLAAEADPRLTPAGHRLLDSASHLFYDRGIRAVGVDLIAEHAGTTKKTLYDCFGSKDALVALYLRRRAARWRRFLLAHLDELPADEPVQRIPGVFDALERWEQHRVRGCAFVNAYAEVGGTDHPAVPVIRADKIWMRSLFQQLAAHARLDDPERTGTHLHLLYEGALVTSTAGGMPDALSEARDAAVRVVSAARS